VHEVLSIQILSGLEGSGPGLHVFFPSLAHSARQYQLHSLDSLPGSKNIPILRVLLNFRRGRRLAQQAQFTARSEDLLTPWATVRSLAVVTSYCEVANAGLVTGH
jgi:hypothetical protein